MKSKARVERRLRRRALRRWVRQQAPHRWIERCLVPVTQAIRADLADFMDAMDDAPAGVRDTVHIQFRQHVR